MPTIPGTHVRTGQSESQRVNCIVDKLVDPTILEFRQIVIYHEAGTRVSQGVWKFSYQNWNDTFGLQVFMDNNPVQMDQSMFSTDYQFGVITVPGATDQDSILCTYCFDYFNPYVMEGFVEKAIGYINVAAIGPLTYFGLNDSPINWDSIIAELVIVYCMEKLIADYDLWKGKLVFAIAPQSLVDGSDNIISQLESIRSAAWERASKALENDMLKKNEYTAPPTNTYYQAILFGGASTRSKGHLLPSMGKLRGFRSNRYGVQ